MIHKPLKKKKCPCGIEFTPKSSLQKYHSPKCQIDHKTGRVDPTDLKSLPLQTLKDIAKGTFCQFIKLRDELLPEITSGVMEKKSDTIHAGHLYPCNQFPGLIFDEDNCFKQAEINNFSMHDHEIWLQTSNNVRKRIGDYNFNSLVEKSHEKFYRNYKWSSIELIEKIEEYNNKIAELKSKRNAGKPVFEVTK